MAVRSRAFVVANLSLDPYVWTDMYVVPAGRTALVREVSIYNQSGRTMNLALAIRRGSGRGIVSNARDVPSGTAASWSQRYLVLHPLDALCFFPEPAAAGGIALAVYAAGSLLQGAPE